MEIFKEVEIKSEKLSIIKCDCCKTKLDCEEYPEGWHKISTYHEEWGNDSVDSWEYYDVCSPECYEKQFIECVKGYKHRNSANIDGFDIAFARKLAEYFSQKHV